jgi:hypothetical protein
MYSGDFGKINNDIWMTCKDLETANHTENSRKLFPTVRTIPKKFQPRVQCIQSKTGTNLTEAPQTAASWKEYCEDLHTDSDGMGIICEYQKREPPPLRSEVTRAIRQKAG